MHSAAIRTPIAAAILLTALTATGAAAGGPALLKLGGVEGDTRAQGHEGVIHIESFAWGASTSAIELEPAYVTSFQTSSSGVDAHARGMNEMSMDDTAGKEPAPQRGAGTAHKDMALKGQSIRQNNAAPVGGSQSITAGGGQTESGQATGKRQHMPIRARAYYDQPLAKGTVWVRVASPWAACRVGAHYPSLELTGGAKTYVLTDVSVATCGRSSAQDDRPTEEVAFYYNKISF